MDIITVLENENEKLKNELFIKISELKKSNIQKDTEVYLKLLHEIGFLEGKIEAFEISIELIKK